MIKLSDRERCVLSVLQFCADASASEVAARAGVREHVVRRVRTRLVEAGVLRRRVYVNYFKLGLSQYSIFLRFNSQTIKHKQRFIKVLQGAPFVELVLEVGGRYDLALILTVRGPFDVEQFLDLVLADMDVAFSEFHMQVRTGWFYFGVKHLHERTPRCVQVIASSGEREEISRAEAETLVAFARSADGNRQRIARQLGIPVTTLQSRLERLERSEILSGALFEVVADRAGSQAFRVLVATHAPHREHRETLRIWAEKHPSILTFMHGFGNWQYELRLEAQDVGSARLIVDDLLERFSSVVSSAELVPVARIALMNLCPSAELLAVQE